MVELMDILSITEEDLNTEQKEIMQKIVTKYDDICSQIREFIQGYKE